MHLELFLEEPSAEACLGDFLHQLLPDGTTWNLIVFQGKSDLLCRLERRLKGYRTWMPDAWRIVVLVDEDRADCLALKRRMEDAAAAAGFMTKTAARGGPFVVLNRIAVEELEAWFLGDPQALVQAYPRVPRTLGTQARYRDPDAIVGGTWEALERLPQRAGYYSTGIAKIEIARNMARYMNPARNTSRSFHCFVRGLAALCPDTPLGSPAAEEGLATGA
ncbi:MAG: DUF4276 family protein [Limisphaerales bacterium]